MNNEELRDINEIRPAGKPLKAITYKPYSACYICIAAGIGMLLLRQWVFLVLGAVRGQGIQNQMRGTDLMKGEPE